MVIIYAYKTIFNFTIWIICVQVTVNNPRNMGESMLFNFGRIISERLLQLCSENFIKNTTNESVPFFQTKVLQLSEERL